MRCANFCEAHVAKAQEPDKAMKFPEALNRLLGQLHADCFVGVSDEREVISNAIEGITPADRKIVAEFLKQFAEQTYNERDLVKQWEASPADVRLGSGDQIAVFFRLVQEALKAR